VNAASKELLHEFGNTGLLGEFGTWKEAMNEVYRLGGTRYYTVCVGINDFWAVRPKSDGEQERDAYWLERR
jgi:hypothetical protein